VCPSSSSRVGRRFGVCKRSDRTSVYLVSLTDSMPHASCPILPQVECEELLLLASESVGSPCSSDLYPHGSFLCSSETNDPVTPRSLDAHGAAAPRRLELPKRPNPHSPSDLGARPASISPAKPGSVSHDQKRVPRLRRVCALSKQDLIGAH
jgi:hypothetical protein